MSESFSQEELQIIDEYVKQGKSIREIALSHKEFGRTKISNIIEKYANSGEERAIEIALRKVSLKHHKEVTSLDEINTEELTEEQIELAYKQIIETRKTLTKVAHDLGRNRETIRRAIIDYLGGDEVGVKEFRRALKDNQNLTKEKDFFENLTEEEKKTMYI